MKIIINIHNADINSFGKMPLFKLREQFNIPSGFIAKIGDKVLRDIASVEQHDEITFIEPEMVIKVKEETTVSKIREKSNVPPDLIAKSYGEILTNDATVASGEEITFSKPGIIEVWIYCDGKGNPIKVLEGSTIAQLIEQTKDTLSLPENFNVHEFDNPEKLLSLDCILQNDDEIELTEV